LECHAQVRAFSELHLSFRPEIVLYFATNVVSTSQIWPPAEATFEKTVECP
jgi:hypothetical protein